MEHCTGLQHRARNNTCILTEVRVLGAGGNAFKRLALDLSWPGARNFTWHSHPQSGTSGILAACNPAAKADRYHVWRRLRPCAHLADTWSRWRACHCAKAIIDSP
jgi:hypothetical protein